MEKDSVVFAVFAVVKGESRMVLVAEVGLEAARGI